MTFRIIAGIALIVFSSILSASGTELQKFSNVTLVEDAYMDGDSFRVNLTSNRQVTIRLYLVDCPETSVSESTGARRVRAQRRYFALSSPRDVIVYGRRAAAFTRHKLQQPFTVYTAFAAAMGRSRGGRYYGFVQTADGQDLATLLVESGYARAYGVPRADYRGRSKGEVVASLRDAEAMAMLQRKGIWKSANAGQLAGLRAKERSENSELKLLYSEINAPSENVDINKASLEELLSLPGIGMATARRIIAGRPYKDTNQLLNISGITSNKYSKLRRYLKDI